MSGKTLPPIHEEWATVFVVIAERLEQIERKIDALCLHMRPKSGAGSRESIRDEGRRLGKLDGDFPIVG